MSIIKSLIELHEGKIWLESKENKGSTFYIQLPKQM
jgi:two-component system sensor histidine kinase VicK